jgi:integrase
MLKEPKKLPRYVTPEDFTKIYKACDKAKRPGGLPFVPEDWWRALLTFAYMTGWRIGEILALRREDLDLEAGTAITRAADNKGGRDELTPLHGVAVDHLKKIACFEPVVFPWYYHDRTLWTDFASIQDAAGISPHYGFHDLRRAFATVNADKLTADALQTLMRHKSYLTTQRYINIARQLNRAVESLYVPDVLRKVN